MGIRELIRAAAQALLGTKTARRLGRYFRRNRPLQQAHVYRDFLSGKRGLEIGGPSDIFGDDGFLPVYRYLGSLDNCLYSSNTLWTGSISEGATFEFHSSKARGQQIICEASDLAMVPSGAYECLLASHCLEHVANPLRALAEWTRVLRPDGMLLLVLPHMEGTFDRRRPVTTLEHLISDRENGVGEDDLTHLPEVLELHDLKLDRAAGSLEQFRQRCLDNYSKRAMHHHVFDTPCAIRVLDYCNFQILRVDNVRPYHIVTLARRCQTRPKNAAFLGSTAEYRRKSPFLADRGR
jgi:SAM-dependent methyltransferase